MTRTRTRSNRIDAYENLTTGEIAEAHLIGETNSGRPLYQFVEGWEPVSRHQNEKGEIFYVPTTRLQQTVDRNWYVR